MDSVLWYVLPLAVAVALSIFPVLAAILLLLSRDPLRTSTSYASGWLLGILSLVTVFAATARLIPHDGSESLPPWVPYGAIAVGVYLAITGIVAAVRDRGREKSLAPPRWLQAASKLSAPRAFVFGVVMNVRPKNLALTLAAGLAIGAAQATFLEEGILVVLFAAVGVSTVAGLVIAYVLAPHRVPSMLTALKGWLVSKAALVLRLSVVAIGVFMVIIGASSAVSDLGAGG